MLPNFQGKNKEFAKTKLIYFLNSDCNAVSQEQYGVY